MSGTPGAGVGELGDIAFDEDTGDVWRKDEVYGTPLSDTFYPTSNSDDGHWTSYGVVDTYNWMTFGLSGTNLVHHAYCAFDSIGIPNAAQIVSAYVKFKAAASNSATTCNLNVYFNDEDSPVIPTTASGADALSLTSVVAWGNVPAWTLNSFYDTPDLTTALQQVVDRSGWVSGNDAMVLIKDNSSSLSTARTVTSYNAPGSDYSALHVTWRNPTGVATWVLKYTTVASLWESRTSVADTIWNSITYGNGMFVAVSQSGTGNRVMTSPDGVNWTARTNAVDTVWRSVIYGNGVFVAVSHTGTGNRVMTSIDGINWDTQSSAADNEWNSVAYGNGVFVAVSQSGTGNRVMTSPDGVNWNIRTSAADNTWNSVAYGNGLFVAVSSTGTGNRVMTSPDGITWTIRTSAADNNWRSVAYGNGLFVAVASSGSGNRVMTSPDGTTWTARTSAADNLWHGVAYGHGMFIAVSYSGTDDRVMTSNDGITWIVRESAVDNNWYSVTYGNGMFVAVASTGTGDRVMTSGKTDVSIVPHGDTAIEKTPVNAIASQGTISVLGAPPIADDDIVIDTQTFLFKASRTGAGEITISSNTTTLNTNIRTAINADMAQVVATDGGSDTNIITATTKGVAANSFVFTADALPHVGVDGSGTLGTTTAGVDGSIGEENELCADASYLYQAISKNTISDANWRRISLGSVY